MIIWFNASFVTVSMVKVFYVSFGIAYFHDSNFLRGLETFGGTCFHRRDQGPN